MLSYQELYTRVTDLFNDSTAATKTIAQDILNDSYKTALDLTGTEDDGEHVIATTADQPIYNISPNVLKLRTARVIGTDSSGTATSTSAGNLVDTAATFTASLIGKYVYNTTDGTYTKITSFTSATSVGVNEDIFASGEGYQIGDGNIYVAEYIASEDTWNQLNQTNVDVSTDVFSRFFIRGTQIEMYPTPATSNNLLVLTYSQLHKDLSADDYETGTVTINNGSTTVTGSGTTFTSAMIGRYINSSTGIWHRIKSFTSTTVLTLETPWQNPTAAGGSTFTIGEMPLIPEKFHRALTYLPISELYLKREEVTLANTYEKKWEKEEKRMVKFGSSKTDRITPRLRNAQYIAVDYSKDKLITTSY